MAITLGHCACRIDPRTGMQRYRCMVHAIQPAREALSDAIADVDVAILTYHYAGKNMERARMHSLRAMLGQALGLVRDAQERMETIDII